MKEFAERVKNSELNMQEKKYPVEYVKRAKELVDARKQAEKDLRDSLTPAKGRDDRLCGQLRELDEQLRIDLAALRTEFGV